MPALCHRGEGLEGLEKMPVYPICWNWALYNEVTGLQCVRLRREALQLSVMMFSWTGDLDKTIRKRKAEEKELINQNCFPRTGDVSQWQNALLVCVRAQDQSPALQERKVSNIIVLYFSSKLLMQRLSLHVADRTVKSIAKVLKNLSYKPGFCTSEEPVLRDTVMMPNRTCGHGLLCVQLYIQ